MIFPLVGKQILNSTTSTLFQNLYEWVSRVYRSTRQTIGHFTGEESIWAVTKEWHIPCDVADELLQPFDSISRSDARVNGQVLHHIEVSSHLVRQPFSNTIGQTITQMPYELRTAVIDYRQLCLHFSNRNKFPQFSIWNLAVDTKSRYNNHINNCSKWYNISRLKNFDPPIEYSQLINIQLITLLNISEFSWLNNKTQ